MPQKDLEKVKEYQKKYRDKNREKAREYHAKYYQENKEHIAEKQKEYQRDWYEKNKEIVIAKSVACRKTPEGKQYSKTYYHNNKEELLAKQKEKYRSDPVLRLQKKEDLKRLREERKLWLIEFKKDKKCKYCNEYESCCLDFHHKNPDTKEGLVSQMIHEAVSMNKILAEIEKCDIVCSNCHRKIHAGILLVDNEISSSPISE